ncbi:hypothetical protein ONE63_008583 [Megalurothrips usitatus]|uniref:HTH CENPB-type domain-containing protein n=1 Tax=Megalurothrips usitatus TaxID=439358 RepID=A0AAV7XQ71_9NEOP|nr:hypothetical protein ONE63_008583 [Megalurothrips usitatus]
MLLNTTMDNKSSLSALRKKRKYGKLSLDQKVQIIRAAEMGYSQRTLASQYNCGKTQVHLLVTQKDLWLSKWERSRKGGGWSRVRGTPSISEINSLVWDFYKKACTNDIDVTVNMLLERAKQVAQSLNVHNFDADYEWLEKFKMEFNVNLPVIFEGDNLLEDPQEEPVDPLLSGYEKSDVYHLGIAELYHRTLPCIGQKSQEHITVCFCIGASGEKEIIGLVFCENACVEGELWNVNVPCFSSPMGQVTLEVYQHSLNVLNQKMNVLGRKVLLYVDDSEFPSDIDKTMSNVEIRSWPWAFNVQEVINNYRLLYCQRLMTSLAASSLDEWNMLGSKAKSLPMSKIMKLVQSAWKQVSSELVQLSFQCKSIATERDLQCQEINNKLLEEIQKLVLLLKASNSNSSTPGPKTVSNIAEEIFCQDSLEINCRSEDEQMSGMQGEDEDVVVGEDQDVVTVPSKSEVNPTILKLEMFIQSLPESARRQDALDLLDKLEGVVQDLLITEKTLCTDIQDKLSI